MGPCLRSLRPVPTLCKPSGGVPADSPRGLSAEPGTPSLWQSCLLQQLHFHILVVRFCLGLLFSYLLLVNIYNVRHQALKRAGIKQWSYQILEQGNNYFNIATICVVLYEPFQKHNTVCINLSLLPAVQKDNPWDYSCLWSEVEQSQYLVSPSTQHIESISHWRTNNPFPFVHTAQHKENTFTMVQSHCLEKIHTI